MTKTITAVKIMRADVPNGNGRVYPMAALEQCVERSMTDTILGVLGTPTTDTGVDISKISHVVENLRIEDGYLIGDITVLQTAQGDILSQLVDAVQIDFRASGIGELSEDKVVNDFKLISIDALYDGADL